MLSLTRKTDYALVALAHLARQKAQGGQSLSARCIADEYDLPRQLLMSVMKGLHRAGLVESKRGVRGGYDLAKSPQRITVAEVVEAIEGPARLTPCCADEEPGDLCTMCAITQRCPITGAIRELNGQIANYLREVTLDTLIKIEQGGKVPRVKKPMTLTISRK